MCGWVCGWVCACVCVCVSRNVSVTVQGFEKHCIRPQCIPYMEGTGELQNPVVKTEEQNITDSGIIIPARPRWKRMPHIPPTAKFEMLAPSRSHWMREHWNPPTSSCPTFSARAEPTYTSPKVIVGSDIISSKSHDTWMRLQKLMIPYSDRWSIAQTKWLVHSLSFGKLELPSHHQHPSVSTAS